MFLGVLTYVISKVDIVEFFFSFGVLFSLLSRTLLWHVSFSVCKIMFVGDFFVIPENSFFLLLLLWLPIIILSLILSFNPFFALPLGSVTVTNYSLFFEIFSIYILSVVISVIYNFGLSSTNPKTCLTQSIYLSLDIRKNP